MKTQAIVLGIGIVSLVFGAMQANSHPDKKAGDKGDAAIQQINKRFADAKPEDYAGDQSCVECHSAKSHNFDQSAHFAFMTDAKLPLSQKGCEGCHGPGKAHAENPDTEVISFGKLSPKDSAAACLRCHGQTMDNSHWKHTQHANADLSCVTCHQLHPDTDLDLPGKGIKRGNAIDPRTQIRVAKQPARQMLLKADEVTLCGQCHQAQVAEFRLNFHHPVPEGQLVCSDCHATHPSKGAVARQTPFKSKCVVCHADKAGPFVYEHDPVAGFGGSGCDECHAPHGSQNPAMLLSRTRGLCAQCHSDKLATHHPGQTCWSAGCHVAPHGSNTNSHLLGN